MNGRIELTKVPSGVWKNAAQSQCPRGQSEKVSWAIKAPERKLRGNLGRNNGREISRSTQRIT